MVKLNIDLPESFFREEERDGYRVSTKTKELWAVELDLLNEFDRVCNKHNLKYIIDYGTLLGAIRHKGFIPWDVDIDVSMLREDYEKLETIAPKEFQNPYFYQNQFTEKKYNHCITRLRRSDTTSINVKDLIYRRKCNQGIFLDIEVFDNVPSNDYNTVSSIHRRCKDICHAIGAISEPPSLREYGTRFTFFSVLRYLLFKMRYCSVNNAWHQLKTNASQFDYSDHVCCLFSDINTWIRPREWFMDIIRIPFENLMLPAPSAYDELLKQCYGDYMTPVVDTRMTVLYVDAGRSYKDVINEDGFYEKICKELNLDLKRLQMSNLDYLKLFSRKIRNKLHL